ncbi:LPXTG cell wall anchor domain-containing protein [uncultured Friedmanniella sp.]|uniref:LPXTG cell wall anchor domain-containing protein n=1 Tax=uncultured Friedmanniella sp. TaxID=335381 RepID=UPI0035C950FC
MNRSVLTLAPLGCALAGALLLPPSAGAAPSPAPSTGVPQVQIALDDGQPSARVGQTLRYAVTVTNVGASPVKDMLITQTVPTGTTVSSARSKGPKPTVVKAKAGPSQLQWKVTVDPGATVTRHSALTLAGADASLLRLASVACLQTGAKASPVVCASDSDLLPAGAEAQSRGDVVLPDPSTAGTSAWWYAGGAGLLALVGAGWLWRRRRHPSPTTV